MIRLVEKEEQKEKYRLCKDRRTNVYIHTLSENDTDNSIEEGLVHCEKCDKLFMGRAYMRHHIIPRKYGGSDFSYNRMWLCKECHNDIEEKTEKWIDSGAHYNVTILKRLAISGGFI